MSLHSPWDSNYPADSNFHSRLGSAVFQSFFSAASLLCVRQPRKKSGSRSLTCCLGSSRAKDVPEGPCEAPGAAVVEVPLRCDGKIAALRSLALGPGAPLLGAQC